MTRKFLCVALVCILAGSTQLASAALIGYYPLNEAAGATSIADTSGFGTASNLGVTNGTGTISIGQPGKLGNAGPDPDRSLATDRAAVATPSPRNVTLTAPYLSSGASQTGPGMLSGERLDLGRFLETGRAADRYTFRTPPLRNVTLTAPYMHNGAYADLRAAVRHHLNASGSLQIFDPTALPVGFQETARTEPAVAADILKTLDARLATPPVLTDAQLADLMAFLAALTSPSAADLSDLVPASVPSGLPVQD